MERFFNITLPADTAYHSLFAAILASTGALPTTDYIIPDRVCELKIISPNSNAANIIYIADKNNANQQGWPLYSGDTFYRQNTRNVIALPDYFIAGSVNSLTYVVFIGCE
jgi:hypothetical protein